MGAGISLAEALGELRRELYAAQEEGAGEQFRFEVEQAELSLEVEFRRDGNGGVKVEVGAWGAAAALNAEGGAGTARRQVLTLTLQVRDEALGGERAKVGRVTGEVGGAGSDAAAGTSGPRPPSGLSDASFEDAQARPWEA
ncbi:trypco2 family protein [Streptomyces sp. NPDC002599]|uniref:trypco2 family protein n=1 Tax=Streptomyces sp. NPDC002599 TaxID=3154421 RepID=UPI003319BCDD